MQKRVYIFWARLAGILCVAALLRLFVLQPFVVEGVSMRPTYVHGDKVLIEKLSKYFGVSRGDVLVIRNPHDHSQIEIKRVIGLPNEEITMGINNVTVIGPDGLAVTYGQDTVIGRGSNEFFRMKLGPEDYFVLGDNRSESTDSREFGAVQLHDIIGRAILTL